MNMREMNTNVSRLFGLLPCALLLNFWYLNKNVASEHRFGLTTRRALLEMLHREAPTVDVISIGSLLKQDFQDAQQRTFGSASAVRNFYRITEHNDTDRTCFMDLSVNQLDRIIDFCAQTDHQSFISKTLREHLFEPKKNTGWMCAQKRTLDGLYQVLEQYANGVFSIPDYLFIIDDDTYINMDRLIRDLLQSHPAHQRHAIAGCNFEFLTKSGMTFPRGGFGTYLSKAAVARLIQPFYCDGRDEHSNLACWRLNIDALGEKQFFVEGMSVVQLMHAYGTQLPFTGVEKWTDTGYCLHSDHGLAYFINFYHITVPDGIVKLDERPTDRVRRQYSFVGLAGENECKNERDQCSTNNRICHKIKPDRMDQLYAELQGKPLVA